MNDYESLVQMARMVNQYQPGLLSVEIDGESPNGIRYKFIDDESARRFFGLRGLQKGIEGKSENLRLDGHDVVELWGE